MSHRHFLLHKPFGYLSQFVTDAKKKRVLGELHDFPAGTMAIGRLDEDSEGLLLLTTDGKMSEAIRSKNIEKEYYVQVDGCIPDEAIAQLRQGVQMPVKGELHLVSAKAVCRLDPAPPFAERSRRVRDDRHGPTSWVSITLTEGKFRQVRKMTAAAGFPTLRLVRVRVGSMLLEELPVGAVREVACFGIA